jgi:hypothetical protein
LGRNFQLFVLSIAVDASAPLGDQSLLLTNPDGSHGPAAPGLISVVPAGSLGSTTPLASAESLTESLEVEASIDLTSLNLDKIRAKKRY